MSKNTNFLGVHLQKIDPPKKDRIFGPYSLGAHNSQTRNHVLQSYMGKSWISSLLHFVLSMLEFYNVVAFKGITMMVSMMVIVSMMAHS